jgi:diacylglycerol O-acyltransferase / wax synthase
VARPEPLSPADIASLNAEQGPIHVHVGGTAIFAGDPPGYAELLAHVERRLNLIPRFRQRVRHVPGRMARPIWEDDPDFDLRRHVIHSALPRPGSDEQLREAVGRIMSQPLDLGRPLWEIHLIENLGGDRFAAVSKTHHALVDGVAAIDVGAVILDPDPEGTDLDLPDRPWQPGAEQRDEQILLSRLTDNRITKLLGTTLEAPRRALDATTSPVTLIRSAGEARKAADDARRTAQGFLELARDSDPVRPTFLNEQIGRDRLVAFAATTLETMKRAAGQSGATVNDVLLSVCAGALRTLFEDRGEPIPTEFAALVPMSIRKPGEERALGNRMTTLLVPLPLRERDPRARLEAVHATTTRLKASEAARAASLIIEASGWVPPTVNRLLGQMNAALGPVNRVVPQRLPWNLVISNVPGPPMPVYLLGRRLQAIHPYVALSPQRRALSIGVISYDGGLFFGLVGDRDRLPELAALPAMIDAALAEQVEAAG